MRLPRVGRPLFGMGLVIVSAVGLAASLLGLVFTARISRSLAADTQAALTVVLSSLETTGDTLTLIDEVIKETRGAIASARATTLGVERTVRNSGDLLTSLSGALGDDLPAVIRSSQQSLETAQASAEVIESALYGLNAVSALTGTTYDPDVPLADSLSDIEDSLDTLPPSFVSIADQLTALQEDALVIGGDLTSLADSLAQIEATLDESHALIAEYQALIGDLSASVAVLKQRLAGQLLALRLVLYFLFAWAALAQIGLLYQGGEMVRYDPGRLEARVRELEAVVEAVQARAGEPEEAPQDAREDRGREGG